MTRTFEQIVEKMLEYKDKADAMEAMADLLLYMGIAEGGEMLAEALKRKEAGEMDEKQLRYAYSSYLQRVGSAGYISFAKFKEQREDGKL
jgi:hypothetical protein